LFHQTNTDGAPNVFSIILAIPHKSVELSLPTPPVLFSQAITVTLFAQTLLFFHPKILLAFPETLLLDVHSLLEVITGWLVVTYKLRFSAYISAFTSFKSSDVTNCIR
jgi:hypothetical protein